MVGVLEPTALFASEELPLSGFDGVLGVRDRTDRFLALCHETEPSAEGCPSRPSDLAAVIFTSGSTGRPKAVLHTQRSLAYKARLMARVHGLGPGDTVLMPAPMAHISGLLNAVLLPGAAGMRVVLMERWDPARGLRLIEEQRVSYMIGPPSIFNGLMEQPGFDRRKVASMRVVSSGMLGVSPEFVAEATRGLGAVVKRSYGSTEAPTVSTCTNEDPPERCRDTDGRAVGDAEIKVVDPSTGRRRPPGRPGEVWVRGPELFAGYAEAAETEAAVHRGWFRTGDLGVLDAGGWLAITGRLKELIIRGGENIAPAEVERALELHPEVVGGRGRRRPRRPAGGAGLRLRGRPLVDRRRGVPTLVRRAGDRPLQGARGGGAGRSPAAPGGGEARPGRPQGPGRGAGRGRPAPVSRVRPVVRRGGSGEDGPMDLSLSDEELAFRDEIRGWLAANLELPAAFSSLEEEFAWGRVWQARLAADRWVGIHWPEPYGGRGATPLQVAIFNLEYARSRAPQPVNRNGINHVGPTLLAHGSEEQKSRWLPRILDAEEVWCQLFSEPGAGSDLAGLTTRADPTEGGWVLTGQKVWTSYAQFARWGIALVRTDPDAPKHRASPTWWST